MKKNFVLDTNIFLSDPDCLNSFGDNNIYIPMVVIEELDKKKNEKGHIGYAARSVIRSLNELFKDKLEKITDGVPLSNGAKVFIVSAPNDFQSTLELDLTVNDNKIINTCDYLKSKKKPHPIIISKDLNFKIKCLALGFKTEEYKKEIVERDSSLLDNRVIEVDTDTILYLHKEPDRGIIDSDKILKVNERCCLQSGEDPSKKVLVYKSRQNVIHKITDITVSGVTPKNIEQKLAMSALLDTDVQVIVFDGLAGTGKTLLTLAAGLELVLNQSQYDQFLVAKPVVSLGNQELGFLPGSEMEKLKPWFGSIFDNLEFISNTSRSKGSKERVDGEKTWETYLDYGKVDILPLYSLRGRSLTRKLIFIDEAQNLSLHEVKTIMTRIGEGSKIIFSGDPSQIDSAFLDSTNNGLVHISSAFSEDEDASKVFSRVFFKESQRSDAAKLGIRLL